MILCSKPSKSQQFRSRFQFSICQFLVTNVGDPKQDVDPRFEEMHPHIINVDASLIDETDAPLPAPVKNANAAPTHFCMRRVVWWRSERIQDREDLLLDLGLGKAAIAQSERSTNSPVRSSRCRKIN